MDALDLSPTDNTTTKVMW